MTKKSKRNMQDATLKNIRPLKERVSKLEHCLELAVGVMDCQALRLDELEQFVTKFHDRVFSERKPAKRGKQ